MGEEVVKLDETKAEEPEKAGEEEKKVEESIEKEPKQHPLIPQPQDIVLRVFMHCEGCARKVRHCLKGFEGVESVETDCKTHKVVVKGQKADPLKVLGRLQRKRHRRVELISPIPQPPAPSNPQPIDKPKAEDNKQPQIITVVLKVHMHCEACAQEIKRRIHRMKGVESVDPDLKSSHVRVKGAIDPAALVEYVHRRTGKHAAIVKQEPEITPDNSEEAANEANEEKKGDAVEGEKKGDGDAASEKKVDEQESKIEEKSGGGGEGEAQQTADSAAEEAPKAVEVKKNEYHYYPQRYIMEMYPYPPPIIGDVYPPPQMAVESYPPPMIGYAYPPQMFSDENPNSCSLM